MLDPAKPVQVDDGGILKIKAIAPFEVEIGLTGEISHRNRNYVTVPAPTSLTSNLSMLQWRATFNGLKYGSKAVTVPPIYFWAEPGLQINLAEHINVGPNSTALQLSRGPRGFGIGEVEADGVELVFLSEADGNPEVGRVTVPPQEAVVGADSITNVQLAPGAVGGPELSQDAVTSSKIANDAVARAKLAEAVRTELDGKLSQTVGDARYAPVALADSVAVKVDKWQQEKAYAAGAVVVNPAGDLVSAKVTFISGTAYNAGNWNLSTSYAKPSDVTAIAPTGGVRAVGKGELMINAKDYGATGDGTTDDFDALQAALNAVPNGGTLFIPPGRYRLAKTGGGGLRIPALTRGISIRGAGKGSTTFVVSNEVLRVFDLYPSSKGLLFKDVRLSDFTVDADNVGVQQVGPSTTVNADTPLPTGANTVLTVASTAGWASKGRLHFPASNAGLKSRTLPFVRQSATQLVILNYSGTAYTATAGDTVHGAVSEHLIVGTLMSGYSTIPANMKFDGITVEDISAINIPTVVGPLLGSGFSSPHYRCAVSIAPLADAADPQPMYIKNVFLRRIEVVGGEAGFYVAGVGTAPNTNSPFIDNIVFEDLHHDCVVKPTENYTSLNFMIGGNGFGDRCIIRRCYGRYSGDVGVETDAMLNSLVEDVVIDDAAGGNFFSTNYNTAARTAAGAPTGLLTTALTSVATSLVVDAVPTSVARSGWVSVDNELMSYTASSDNSSSTTLTVVRGLNGSVATAHSAGAVVIFKEAEKQFVEYVNCTSRHFDVGTVAGGTWMPKGWYQLARIPNVNPQVVIKSCKYENYAVDMGSQPGGGSGEGLHFQGEIASVLIDGLLMERHGVFAPDSSVFKRGALVSFISNSGTKTKSTLTFRDLRIKVSGRLGGGTAPPSYVPLYLDNGDWLLDWKSIQISTFLAGARPGMTSMMNFAAAGGNAISGVIEKVRYRSDRGDLAPIGLRIPAYPQCDVLYLTLKDIDLTAMRFSAGAGSLNYNPFPIDSTNVGKVLFEGLRHSSDAATSQIAARTPISAAVTANYALTSRDEYVGVKAAAALTVTLLPATSGASATLPKPTTGKELVIKDELGNAAANNITIAAAGSETIDGAATKVIATNWGSVRLRSVGTGWVSV
tara:strand:- start:1356 stop:4745 length:3390 start_codon:yes stop_codon:yes gene_type:complete